MKKPYVTPTLEKIAFRYRDQVVAASGEPGETVTLFCTPDTVCTQPENLQK